jgi:hypothetical protein
MLLQACVAVVLNVITTSAAAIITITTANTAKTTTATTATATAAAAAAAASTASRITTTLSYSVTKLHIFLMFFLKCSNNERAHLLYNVAYFYEIVY